MIGRLGRSRREAANQARVELAEVHALSRRPLISVVMPTYETEQRHLREAIESVQRQRYPAWELCIADDGSRRPEVRAALDSHRRADPRIKVVFAEHGGIAAATNAALELCTGEFVACLDHDDVLTPDALLRVAQALDADPELDVVYSDSDKLTMHGTRADPFFKPDWSPTYALGAMYIGHLLVARRSLIERVGGFDPDYDTIQDFELMLRLSEATDRIHHIPRILYHWRAVPGSIAAGAEQKPGVSELQANAVNAHLRRIGVDAVAVPHPAIPHRARLEPSPNGRSRSRQAAERVSMVIVARSRRGAVERLLDSVFAVSDHPPAEVIVVTADPEWSSEHPVHVVVDPAAQRARARAANRGAAVATGGWILFASDVAEVVEPDWLARLMAHAALPEVAAVGPLIVRPDGRTQAAGFATGLDDPVAPMLAGIDAGSDGYYGALACARDVSAISGEFMLVRGAAFRDLGGFEESYLSGFEDYDLCQQLRAAGNTIVYAPRPQVVVHETEAGRREALDVVDRALYVDRWYDELKTGDPYFNPNFAASDANFVTDR